MKIDAPKARAIVMPKKSRDHLIAETLSKERFLYAWKHQFQDGDSLIPVRILREADYKKLVKAAKKGEAK